MGLFKPGMFRFLRAMTAPPTSAEVPPPDPLPPAARARQEREERAAREEEERHRAAAAEFERTVKAAGVWFPGDFIQMEDRERRSWREAILERIFAVWR